MNLLSTTLGNALKKYFLLFLISLPFLTCAQTHAIDIGEFNNGVIDIHKREREITKAFEWTFRDGTKVTELKVEQMGNNYFIVATCVYQGHKRMAAVDLDMEGIHFLVNEDAFFKMCSAVSCETCRFFLENNKIVACKCEETGTISNHCHYKSSPALSFYTNLQRAISMGAEKN